jgi:hypothetical protein
LAVYHAKKLVILEWKEGRHEKFLKQSANNKIIYFGLNQQQWLASLRNRKKIDHKETAGHKTALKILSGRGGGRERARVTLEDLCLKISSPEKVIIAIRFRTAYKVEN